ncbi:unnamed protein product [Rotaria magnacalcarata]|uniref:Uncharacterized protein n=1 Tax=Rotaria magnacalcarata TaxID=392030 RepID=A0A819KAX6_9BILA|nr:unnamed protein product [Rotaria magnacalcarata]CAF3945875.1 unnamed protein product [Rotaria magnacalcarata]
MEHRALINRTNLNDVLSELVEDPSANENDKAKYIINFLLLNYLFFVSDIIEDINKYQQITKCKKVELLNIKSELQHCSHKSRIILMELTNNHDTDDDDEHAQFFFTISSKNVDDFINDDLEYLPRTGSHDAFR